MMKFTIQSSMKVTDSENFSILVSETGLTIHHSTMLLIMKRDLFEKKTIFTESGEKIHMYLYLTFHYQLLKLYT